MNRLNKEDVRTLNQDTFDLKDSPLKPQHLIDLFIRPKKFFSSQIALGKKPYVLFVTWCCGIAFSMNDPYVSQMESWMNFWAFFLVAGIISGLGIWYFGGWWYRIRIQWSGQSNPHKRLSRLIYIYSSFVWGLPIILITLLMTILSYRNYQGAWSIKEVWGYIFSISYISPFWSFIVSYKGVTTVFGLKRWNALTWFVILPFIVYFFILWISVVLIPIMMVM